MYTQNQETSTMEALVAGALNVTGLLQLFAQFQEMHFIHHE